ncbi:MAG: amidophosphoribosyltransferase [Candidatus Berkiellales bacterium]
MCGVVGIVATSPVNQTIFDALNVLQHRGQDAAGMVTCHQKRFILRKGNGLARNVFRASDMQRLVGNMGIGHIRYPTAGSTCAAEAQPLYVNSPYGIVLAHNGNLTNAEELKEKLFREDLRHINTDSDSEIILNIFAHELQRYCGETLTKEAVFKAISGVHRRCRGGYAVVALIAGEGMVAFRDPFGIRPLIYGVRETDRGKEVMVASESVALTSQGFTIVSDVAPGEALFIQGGKIHQNQCAPHSQLSPCLFEYVYLARPDSIIDKISVYQFRLNLGKKLAAKIQREWSHLKIDVVIPIPETSRSAAISLANQLQVEFREGFVKNRYVGRTFIMPGQMIRNKSVRQKLSVIESEFSHKNVLLVDDSIVRGTTSKEIIQLAREAGASNVYFASAAPPIRFPNIYGIDIPVIQELIAHNRTVEEIKEQIGADGLIYTDLTDLIDTARAGNPFIERFESAVFDGVYLTGDEAAYLERMATFRTDRAKQSQTLPVDECQIDLTNH